MRLLISSLVACALSLSTSDVRYLVIPPPRSIDASGPPRSLPRSSLSVTISETSATAKAMIQNAVDRQAHKWIGNSTASIGETVLSGIRIVLSEGSSLQLDSSTDYSYSLSIIEGEDIAHIEAVSSYGAMYALESFSQLCAGASLPYSSVEIVDSPSWPHRGLMIDSGRRFFPVPLVENLLDTMAAVKMNVLHLHASDMCRFGVESKTYPELTANLTGIFGGFYSQSDIAALIAYATARGIRVIPEFDLPGHSRGMLPLQAAGAIFCDPTDSTVSQLYGDPANATLNVLLPLLAEMSSLFPDPVFHIGADETGVVGPCTIESTFALERFVLDNIQNALNKTPSGWEEVLFDADAATPETLVYAWSRHAPFEIINTGRSAVDSNDTHFYFTSPAGEFPGGWTPCWYDIGAGLNASQAVLLQGGEASMWSDTYCDIDQCGASEGPNPAGSVLFPPTMDAYFSVSVGGMIWPRGYVAASAYWNYNASVSPTDPAFAAAIWSLNDQVRGQGGFTCPSNCACDQLTQCGAPILPVPQPTTGMQVVGAPCLLPISPLQSFFFTADMKIAATNGSSEFCIINPGGVVDVYPLVIGDCSDPNAVVWQHPGAANAARIIDASTGACLDLEDGSSYIGTYGCGSGDGILQANQAWSFDGSGGKAGPALSFSGGACITLVPAA